MTARITYRTQYGKKCYLTVRIEKLLQEIKDMRKAKLTILRVQFPKLTVS